MELVSAGAQNMSTNQSATMDGEAVFTDAVWGGSGSGSGSFELTKNLKEGLENAGLQVNQTLWDFYASGDGSSYKRGAGVINYGADLDWSINECPLDVITGMNGFVHGVEFVNGFAYYKLILIGWDLLAAAGVVWMGLRLRRKLRMPRVVTENTEA